MAMLYTPQQMAGGPGFTRGVRLGNWSEDVALEEARTADFLRRRERGELLLSKVSAKQAKYLQPVPHSYSRDGSVHFGDTLVLRHIETGAAVATDPQEKIQGEDVAVTGQPNAPRAVARNTVVIMPAGGRDGGEEGAPLCYGQTFRLACNPSLRVNDDGLSQPPLFLSSAAATPTTGRKAPLTGHQQVCMTLARGADTVWVVRAPNVGLVGSPVPADEEVVILHRNTNQGLALDKSAVGNTDFGREYEICCHSYKAKARPLPINHPAADLGASVPVESPNLWKFESSGSEEQAADERHFREPSVEDVMEQIRRVAARRGAHGLRGMGRAFHAMDDSGNGTLDRAELKYGLRDLGVALCDDQLDQVLQAYDRNGDGVISFNEFLRALRGSMNDRRRAVVQRAYDVLDVSGDGRVTMEDVEMRYNADLHPDVLSGKRTARDVLYDFMAQWDRIERDGVVTREEFEDYYADVSACIDDDDYFDRMVKNAWHLSDSDGTAADTNLRVLVTHYNGMQEVVAVENDMGLDASNAEAVKARLREQGVKDIMAVETE